MSVKNLDAVAAAYKAEFQWGNEHREVVVISNHLLGTSVTYYADEEHKKRFPEEWKRFQESTPSAEAFKPPKDLDALLTRLRQAEDEVKVLRMADKALRARIAEALRG